MNGSFELPRLCKFMKRREFIQGAVGSAGILLLNGARAVTPCPPAINGATSSSCGASGRSLEETANSLLPGQSTQFTRNTIQHPYDIQWNVQTIFYDELRREIQYMGKPASGQSLDHSHYIYDEVTDTWTDVGVVVSGTGHIWSVTFDPDTGDHYFVQYGGQRIWRFRRSDGVALGSWTELGDPNPDLTSGDVNPLLGWHPNLFGPGQGGVYAHCTFYGAAYNPSNNTWTRVTNGSWSAPMRQRPAGQGLYMPGNDRLAMWGNYRKEVIWVEAGAGLSSDVVGEGLVHAGGEAPITIVGAGGGTVHGHIVHHPDDKNKLLCLEEHGSARVWDSTDDGDTWTLKGYTHPFDAMDNLSGGEWTCGTLAPHGVVIGMTSNNTGGETVLWKPNS